MMRLRHLREVVVCVNVFAQLAVAQQYVCHYPDGTPWEGLHEASYNAYIPYDHISGTTVCYYHIAGDLYPFTKIYKGDGNSLEDLFPVTPARVFHTLFFQYNQQQGVGLHDASQTRNYGAFSPWNANTLSDADEDGIRYDATFGTMPAMQI